MKTSPADALFARYVEALVLDGVRPSIDDLAAGDEELRVALAERVAAFARVDGVLSRPQQSLVGTTAGRYEVLATLGSGGMGEVYRARDTRLGREVALKVLPPLFALDVRRLARFEREARLLAALRHPNVATIYGIERSDDLTFLVLELVPGETLAERLRRGALEILEALRLLGGVATGLEAAHAKGIVHRDLKPANVQITPETHAKVLDFGLGKDGGAEDPELARRTSTRFAPTITGMILGTASYMSPEQARGREVDERTDVWSFGCVLYEALTGRRAFPGETFTDAVARVFHHEPDWGRLPPGTPVTIRRLLRRCLEKDVEERLGTIREARVAIEKALGGGRRGLRAGSPAALLAALAVVLALAPLHRTERGAARAAMVSMRASSPRAAPLPPLDMAAYRSSLVAAYSRWRESYDRRLGSASPGGSLVAYVTASEPAAVEVISVESNSIVERIPLPVRASTDLVVGLALTPDGTRAYAAAQMESDRVFVIDTSTGTLLAVPDGDGIRVGDEPNYLALTPDGTRAYVSHLSGHVAVIDTDPGSPTYHRRLDVPDGADFRLAGRPRGLVLSPDGARLYVASEEPGTLTVIDTDTRSPTFHRRLPVPDGEAIRVGPGPGRLMSFNPEGTRLYVPTSLSDEVSIIDTKPGSSTFHRVLSTVPVRQHPVSAAVTPDGSLAYVVDFNFTTVSILDTASASLVLEPIEVGVLPTWIAFTPDGSRGFVPNDNSRYLSVIDTDPRSPTFRTVVATIRTRGRPHCVVVVPRLSVARS